KTGREKAGCRTGRTATASGAARRESVWGRPTAARVDGPAGRRHRPGARAGGLPPARAPGQSGHCGLAEDLNGFAQGRPFLVEALVLDLLQLLVADLELLGDHLVGLAHVVDEVLRGDQRVEDFLLLLSGQGFGAHGI